MFYKLLNVSDKTGIGTVKVVFRSATTTGTTETVKSSGVRVHKAHFSTKTGKVSTKDESHVEKNQQLRAFYTAMEAVGRDLEWQGIAPTRASVGSSLEVEASAVEVYTELKRVRVAKVADRREGLLTEIAATQAQLAALEAELAKTEMYLGIRPKALLVSDLILKYKDLKRLGTGNVEKVKASSLKAYDVLANVVNRYDRSLTLDAMNLESLAAFQAHLTGRGVVNSSTRETIGKLKTVLRYYARRNGLPHEYLAELQYVKDKGGVDANEALILSATELAELEALPIPDANRAQIEVRRQFLFAVETGLRRSDYQVSKGNIKGSELEVPTQKTGKVVRIPFTPRARTLFAEAGYDFRLFIEAQFNQALRAICKKLPSMQEEITRYTPVGDELKKETLPKWDWMTSHVARKTFAHNALSKGISSLAVAEWMAHTTTAMLDKHYTNKRELARQEAHKLLAQPKPSRKRTPSA